LTEAEIQHRRQRVAFLLRSGRSIREAAAEVGLAEATVYKIRRQLIGPRQSSPRPFTADEIARIEAMLDDGASLAEVARTVGRSYTLLQRRFPGRGWTREQCGEYNSMIRTLGTAL